MSEQIIRLGYGCWVFYAVWEERGKWRVNFQKNIHDDNDVNKYDNEISKIEKRRFKTKKELFFEIDNLERKTMPITKGDNLVSGDSIFWALIICIFLISALSVKLYTTELRVGILEDHDLVEKPELLKGLLKGVTDAE